MLSLNLRAAVAVGLAGMGLMAAPASVAGGQPAAQAGFVRGVYGKDASSTGYQVVASSGFNSVMTGPYSELLDNVSAAGLHGVVWLGNFLNAPKCAFEKDDATITRLVQGIAGNPSITAYYLGDEPHVTECPGAPALFKQRTALVHALAPGSQTFTVIQASENGVSHDYAPWAGSVDVIGFDVYPCVKASNVCNFGAIDAAIKAIRDARISRYWAILQDFQDCYYRLPTPSELAGQFDHWSRSDMSGYFVFSWNYQPADTRCTGAALDGHADNIAQLKIENSRVFPASSVPGASAQASSISPAPVVAIVVIGAALVLFTLLALRTRRRRRSRSS